MTDKPKTPREWALYRAAMKAQLGSETVDGRQSAPSGMESHEYASYMILAALQELADAMRLEPQPAAQPTDSERQLIEQVTIVRNFPGHVGNYDQNLPGRECRSGEESSFRHGWSMAVSAINDRLTAMQAEQRDEKAGG